VLLRGGRRARAEHCCDSLATAAQHLLAYGSFMGNEVTTPWGTARSIAEVVVPQCSSGKTGKAFSPVVQLLETRDGERLVRFAYRTEGTVRRGPVTVRVKDLARARAALERVPELRDALVGRP
jgi:hypothetical protein